MNLIFAFLCALAIQVKSQTKEIGMADIFPAKILAQWKTISEHSDLYVTCSMFGIKRNISVYVYLCKDDDCGIRKTVQKPDQNDSTFTIFRAGPHHSGNYSCVYSFSYGLHFKVAKRGYNIIQILVIDLSVAGPSTVSEGDHVEFRCTVSHILQTLDGCQLIQAYLKRNESIIQGQVFNVTRMEVMFTIEEARERDSGHYNCVVLPSRCIQERSRTGNNTVLLEVRASVIMQVMKYCWIIALIISLGLCLWWISNLRRQTIGTKFKASQQANTDGLEEQQEQIEGEDLEAVDGESFSMEWEDKYQSSVNDDISTDYDDVEERVYCVANDPPSG